MNVSAAPPQHVLNGFLHSFLDSSRTNAPFPAVRLPELGLSQADKRRIRDRSHIMGRHIFADKGEAFIDSQVLSLQLMFQYKSTSIFSVLLNRLRIPPA